MKTKTTKEQLELIKKAKGHDPDAFTTLMQSYMKDMYRTAVAIVMNDADAADAIGDTILACWEKLETLKNNAYFKTWMIRILINNCYDIRRQKERLTSMDDYEETAVTDESNLEFKELLSILDERYRIPMLLYYGQGYKIKEIAELLHIPISTVQTRLDRGRNKLKAYYQTERNNHHEKR